jgi:cyanate lyase
MTRDKATLLIAEAKDSKKLTYEEIAAAVGRHKVWVTSALLGQAAMSAEEAQKVVELLELPPEVADALQRVPMRGALEEAIPKDPLIYRFYEIVQVYGTTIKAIVHEMFGDGIVSAIDFEMDIQKVEDPKGARVLLTMNGKFLPYRKW